MKETTEQNEAPSCTTLYDLPLEMLDIILQKSYLHWVLNSPTCQGDEEVIRSLISVDVCFNRRITRHRFKKAIGHFYRISTKRSSIIVNNRNYLLDNIQPNDELIASMLSLNCITEEQSHFIQRQRSDRDKNAELLYAVQPFDDTQFSNFVKCLRQTNQKTVARIIEEGGGVIKIEVQTRDAKCASMETQLLHEELEDLLNGINSRSNQTDKLITKLKHEGIQILDSQLDRQTVVVWIWCHTQAAFDHIQMLHQSNQLTLFDNIQPSISKDINIDGNQFKKTVVVCPLSINFTQRIEIRRENELSCHVLGLAKLRNEIYILCLSSSYREIRVFDDRNPVSFQKKINIEEIYNPIDIVSSEMENCLFVSDYGENCVWKIRRETDNEHKIIKWLTTDYEPETLSMTTDGQLVVVSNSSSILNIYRSDAELIQFVLLPSDIDEPIHAVETSIGNFIIFHERMKNVEEESVSSGKERETKWVVGELTVDGQMVIHRFIPSNETQELNDPSYLSIDSDDQVLVADRGNGRVILFDSDLEWNRILCPTIGETAETKIRYPHRLCYDEEKKQLIVGGVSEVNVYTLSRN